MRSKGIRVGLAVAASFVVGAMLIPSTASATHFRYGHYFWSPGAGNNINFTLQNGFRRSGYSCLNPATQAGVACTGPGGLPGPGDVFEETIGGTLFDFGDGSPAIGSPAGALEYLVTSIDPAQDNLSALALDPTSLPGPATDTSIDHSYVTPPTDFLAFTESSARISTLINNPDGAYRVETLVNVGTGNSSPRSSLPPVVTCPVNGNCSFLVPGSDPNGDTLRFEFSTPAQGGGGQTQPGPPFATNTAAINSTTGEFTWDTNGAGVAGDLYTAQVKITDLNASGQPKSHVVVDWIIRLVDVVGVPPQFDHPPTPACGSTVPASVGQQLSFDVQGSDGDQGSTVTLTAAGVPAGATTTPVLPTSGNPVTATFNWTPTAAQAGTHVVTFQATDNDGQSVLCSVTIDVGAAPEPTPEPTPQPTPEPTPQPTPLPAPTQRGFHFSMRFDYVDKHGKAFVRATVFCHSPQCNLAGDGKLKILPFATGGERSPRASFNLGSAQSSFPYARGRNAVGKLRFEVPQAGADAVQEAIDAGARGKVRASITINGANGLDSRATKKRFRNIKLFAGPLQ